MKHWRKPKNINQSAKTEKNFKSAKPKAEKNFKSEKAEKQFFYVFILT